MYINIDIIKKALPSLTIIRRLGSGGQRCVYLVSSPDFGKCALKVIGPTSNLRIDREIEAIRRGIPNTPKIFQVDSFKCNGDEISYLIEEYIDGVELSEILNNKKHLDKDEILKLAFYLLETAFESEKKEIVHRDIKPQNIKLGNDGRFYLLDFGIVRILDLDSLTDSSLPFGPHSPGYSPREQILNKKEFIDGRSDLFSIGITLYECVFGYNPFIQGAKNRDEINSRVINLYLPPDVIEWDNNKLFLGFILHLTQKYPRQRPSSCESAFIQFKEIRKELEG